MCLAKSSPVARGALRGARPGALTSAAMPEETEWHAHARPPIRTSGTSAYQAPPGSARPSRGAHECEIPRCWRAAWSRPERVDKYLTNAYRHSTVAPLLPSRGALGGHVTCLGTPARVYASSLRRCWLLWRRLRLASRLLSPAPAGLRGRDRAPLRHAAAAQAAIRRPDARRPVRCVPGRLSQPRAPLPDAPEESVAGAKWRRQRAW
jgi:hypothetical protein